ncbi:MAG: hypothetical protein M3114_06285 [Thermoproteota archaeon]|nr:hypothetical protein [Thermoproteota archaeon]
MTSPSLYVTVYAQTTPSEDPFASARESYRLAEERYYALFNPTQTTLQIINSVRQECEAANFIGSVCISLEYESPNTVVLNGDRLILDTTGLLTGGGYWPNPYIWKAVDGFKGLGYSLTFMELGGQGSQGNPHEYILVLSK